MHAVQFAIVDHFQISSSFLRFLLPISSSMAMDPTAVDIRDSTTRVRTAEIEIKLQSLRRGL